jgi:hypothetical protein
LLLGGLMRGEKNAVNGVLLGMLFRMGVPLGGGFALHQLSKGLAEAGVFGMILAYYFVTLFAETLLAVKLVAPEKGDRSNLCEAPDGPPRQIGPVPFFRPNGQAEERD